MATRWTQVAGEVLAQFSSTARRYTQVVLEVATQLAATRRTTHVAVEVATQATTATRQYTQVVAEALADFVGDPDPTPLCPILTFVQGTRCTGVFIEGTPYSHPSAVAHLETDWYVYRVSDDALVWSSLNDSVNLESVDVPDATLAEITSYYAIACYRATDLTECCTGPFYFVTPSCDGIPCVNLHARPIIRIEVWDLLSAEGGSRQAILWDRRLPSGSSAGHVTDAIETNELRGRETLEIRLPYDIPQKDRIEGRQVIRVVYEGGDFREWLIQEPARWRDSEDGRYRSFDCEAAWYRLREYTMRQVQEDGQAVMSYGSFGLLPRDQISFLFDSSLHPFMPTFFSAGVVINNSAVSLDFTNGSPLAILNAMAEILGEELQIVKRDGSGNDDYLIHIIPEIGSTCPTLEIRYRKNEQAIRREHDFSELATQVCMVGQALSGDILDIAEAEWTVKRVTGSGPYVVELYDDPFVFDDQMNPPAPASVIYLENRRTGDLYEVIDTDATGQSVTLNAVGSLAPLDIIRFRATDPVFDGVADLVCLSNPTGIGNYGIVSPPQPQAAIPYGNNLVPNAFFNRWNPALTAPTDWALVGLPTVTRESATIWVQNGSFSARIVAPSIGEGLVSFNTPIFPVLPVGSSPGSVYFSAHANVLIRSGSVTLSVILEDASNNVIATHTTPATTILNQFVEIEFSGIDATGAAFARIQLISDSTSTEFIIDAVQFTQTPGRLDSFIEGLGSNALWFEMNRVLLERGVPQLRYTIPIADLNRLDPTTYAFDQVNLGAPAHVVDEELDIEENLRIVGITRNLLQDGETTIEVAARNEGLSRFLATDRIASRRGIRATGQGSGGGPAVPPTQSDVGVINCLAVQDQVGNHRVRWSHNQVIEDEAGSGRFTVVVTERVYYPGPAWTTIQITNVHPAVDPANDGASNTVPNQGYQDYIYSFGSEEKRFEFEVTLYDTGSPVMTCTSSYTDSIYGTLP